VDRLFSKVLLEANAVEIVLTMAVCCVCMLRDACAVQMTDDYVNMCGNIMYPAVSMNKISAHFELCLRWILHGIAAA
jgi:hypothetical protein